MCLLRWLTKSKRKETIMLNDVKSAFGRYVETVKDVIARLQAKVASLAAERDAALAKVAAVDAESNALLNEIDVATADLMPAATPPFEPSNN